VLYEYADKATELSSTAEDFAVDSGVALSHLTAAEELGTRLDLGYSLGRGRTFLESTLDEACHILGLCGVEVIGDIATDLGEAGHRA